MCFFLQLGHTLSWALTFHKGVELPCQPCFRFAEVLRAKHCGMPKEIPIRFGMSDVAWLENSSHTETRGIFYHIYGV